MHFFLVSQNVNYSAPNLFIYIPVLNSCSRGSAIFTCDAFWRNWNFFYCLLLPPFCLPSPAIVSFRLPSEVRTGDHSLSFCFPHNPVKYVYKVCYNIHSYFIHPVLPQVRPLWYFSIQPQEPLKYTYLQHLF